ncbi:MAG: D-2-hydroxyacid dehydrogenase, partial [Firmicutes bacterium]|nr:D-2-hydroxyacid dehydrogenase [Bacillota bacterium]
MQTDNMNILVYHPRLADRYADAVRECGMACTAATNEAEASALIEQADALLCWDFPHDLLKRAQRLKLLQVTGAGVDHMLGAAVADPTRPFALTRIVGQFGAPIAEYVFAHLLSIVQELPALRQAQEQRRWSPVPTHALHGETLAVIGVGSIGGQIARVGKAFGMRVHGLSRSGNSVADVDAMFTCASWSACVRDALCIVVALPLTPATVGFVGADEFASVRDDAVFVNIGRGRLVDEEALVAHLAAGGLRAAVLDVFATEPLPADHALWTAPRVVVTPHMSGRSQPSTVAAFFVENVRRHIAK